MDSTFSKPKAQNLYLKLLAKPRAQNLHLKLLAKPFAMHKALRASRLCEQDVSFTMGALTMHKALRASSSSEGHM